MASKWLRDPLFHFLLIGAAVFGVVQLVLPPDSAGQVIVVDDRLRDELAGKFAASTGRTAGDADLAAMVDAWVLEEALYREGVSLGFGETDGFVRERIIALVRGAIKEAITLPISAPPADDLQRYFTANRERYIQHARFDIEHTLLRDGRPAAREEAEALYARLASGAAPADLDRRFLATKGRTAQQLAAIFGDDFATQLQSLDVGDWYVLQSQRGWHVLRIAAIAPGKVPTYEDVEARVVDDWRQDRARELTGSQLRAIQSRYRVVGGSDAG